MKGYTIQHSIELLERQAGSGSGGASTASEVSFDNTGTGLVATNVQSAISEVNAKIPDYVTKVVHLESVSIPNQTPVDVTIETIPGTIISCSGVFYDSGAVFTLPDPGLRVAFTDASTVQFATFGASTWSGDVYLIVDYIPTPANTRKSKKK